MFTFHPFLRLPLELRKTIWEMSANAREVVVDVEYCDMIKSYHSVTRIPEVLQACRESRLHLEDSYSKAFRTNSQPHYIWVNFNVDSIRVTQESLLDIVMEWNSIRHLTVECKDFDIFQEYYLDDVRALHDTGLRTLTIIDIGGSGDKLDEYWWINWIYNLMEEFYYRCDPVPFYTRVIAPSDPSGREVTTDNYISQYRDYRKAYEEGDPDYADIYDSRSEDGKERMFTPWKTY